MLFGEAGHAQIETSVVDQNEHIGAMSEQIGLALAHDPADGTQVFGHFQKTHECHVAVVPHKHRPGGFHLFATIGPALRIRIVPTNGFDQICAMKIAGAFTRNEIIRHIVQQRPAGRSLLAKIIHKVFGRFVKPELVQPGRRTGRFSDGGEGAFQDFPDLHDENFTTGHFALHKIDIEV